MNKKLVVIGVCGLLLVSAFASSAFADQSIGFQEYFHKGVKAFEQHDDQEALRCFKIAQIYDPADQGLNKYINILEKMAITVKLISSRQAGDESVGYKYYLAKGIEEFQKHEYKEAIHYLNIAIIFNPDSREADQYLETLAQPTASVPQIVPESQPLPSIPPQPAAIMPQAVTTQSAQQPVEQTVEQPVEQPVPQAQPYSPPPEQQPAPIAAQPVLYVPIQNVKKPVTVISLAQLTSNGNIKPRLQIEYHSSVIIEGRNIQRFLVVDENFITIRTIDTDHIEVDAQAIGTTFLHVWDDSGRHTFYVEIIFPKSLLSNTSQTASEVQHSQPFKGTYSNDWSTYYSGKNIPQLKRQNSDLDESIAVIGETPYGFFDTSGSYSDYDSISQVDTYTIGLSQIPLEGTSDFNLRAFDALRYLSPLTMPGTRLRGVFADVDLMGDVLGLSVSHGQQQAPLGFLSTSEAQFTNSYIDAAKLTLFPKSQTDQYSFNYATSYGPDRQTYLSDHVYSVEGQHKFNDFLTLNAEEASDSDHDSSLASLKWQEGEFKTGLNFRNIDKDYATVSTLPAYQGETGVVWTTDSDFKNIKEDTFVEAYRDRLDANPNDESAYNYDGNGQVRVNFTDNFWSDSDLNFVDTPGEISPMDSIGLNERLSRSFGIWNSMKGTVFGGVGYQDSHSSDLDTTNFSREDVISGIQLPLTKRISAYANYEYDWLSQPDDGGDSNPSVINAGLEYQRQVTPKLSFNSQVDYHDELGVNSGSTGFLSGEESVIITSGFNYTPTPDVNIFADGNASKVLSHTGSPSYDDFEVHVGMRITFGGSSYWDPLGTVSGIVFKDRNGDGKFVAGDEGIAGVKLKVGDKEVVTDKNGHFSVQIRAKGVAVVPELDSIPGGLIFSTPQTLNVPVHQGRRTQADFGLISQTGIYGLVFVDKNGSGVPNEGDKFIGKVKVILDGKIIQKSDLHGAFYFRKVSPGPHIISIDINSIAINMVPLMKLENKIDVPEGSNYMFNIPLKVKEAQGDQD